MTEDGIARTLYTVNQDVDTWHLLLLWRHDFGLYMSPVQLAPSLHYEKVIAHLKVELRSRADRALPPRVSLLAARRCRRRQRPVRRESDGKPRVHTFPFLCRGLRTPASVSSAATARRSSEPSFGWEGWRLLVAGISESSAGRRKGAGS